MNRDEADEIVIQARLQAGWITEADLLNENEALEDEAESEDAGGVDETVAEQG